MTTRIDNLHARKQMLLAAQGKLSAALAPLDPYSNDGYSIRLALNMIESQVAQVGSEIEQMQNTPDATTPADPDELKRIQEATEKLHALNVESQAARDILAIITSILEGAGRQSLARAAVRSAATPAARAAATATLAWSAAVLRDGRYTGGTELFRFELRVDSSVSKMVSADVFARASGDESVWLASLRTRPGDTFGSAAGTSAIVAADRNDAIAMGRISLQPSAGSVIQMELVLDSALDGIPWGRPILAALDWQGESLRRLGLEIEHEEGIELPPETTFDGAPMNLALALAKAGIESWASGTSSKLPNPPPIREGDDQSGWSEKDLEGLMRDYAQTALDHPSFDVHLLWLSRSNRAGLFGVMFDSDDDLQRQGVAIFADEIRAAVGPSQAPRKLIQTTIHELGHALNLAHRFERVVGCADSASFMNYDWRYKGGNHTEEFWRRFAFSFDGDELAFLRHGPFPALIPGGRAFHSVRYWADGNGGYSPYLNEVPLPGIKLELLPPQGAAAPVFAFGQPILLGLRLTNTGERTLTVPSYLLDPKAGFVEVAIRRVHLENRDRRDVRSFSPIIARCFDSAREDEIALKPGETLSDNLNLTFGASGFPFAEPGFYEVTAFLVVYDRSRERDMIAPSQTIRMRIGAPHSDDEERDATVLVSAAAGRYFALGGTRSPVEDALLEIADRRTGTKRGRGARDDAPRVVDPIAVNILRSMAFRVGRNYHGRDDGKIRLVQKAKPSDALKALDLISDNAFGVFDPVTAEATRSYREALRKGR